MKKAPFTNLTRAAVENAALPPVRSEPLFSVSRFRAALVKHGIIFPEAIEDAEGFDGGRTLAATRAAYDELTENAPRERPAVAGTLDGVVGRED